MSTKFILRFDDVTPQMAWSNFLPLKKIVEGLGIRSVLGVVPDCKDPKLSIEPKVDHFYDQVRKWYDFGDSIAQHGTHHLYDSNSSNLLGVNQRSEFAGHSFVIQFDKILKGKEILVNEGVWQPWFMAPNHSFDVATLEALNKLDFVAITDGYGFYPYLSHSLLFVPQMTSFPIKIGFGLSTICLHINSMTPSDILTITQFILGNKDKFVDFKDVVEDGSVNGMHATSQRMISRTLLRSYRSIKAL